MIRPLTLVSNTLGTALGDALADNPTFGYAGGAAFFGTLLAAIAAAYFFTTISRALLFWAAFILTRPLGATLGDLLTKAHEDGGLELSRIASTGTLFAFMGAAVWLASRATFIREKSAALASSEVI